MKSPTAFTKHPNDNLAYIKSIFADRFKEMRIERKYTQNHLAQILYVSRSSICAWECGKVMPSMNMLIAICETLNISLDYILGIINEKLPCTNEREVVNYSMARYLDISALNQDSVYKIVNFYHTLIDSQKQ